MTTTVTVKTGEWPVEVSLNDNYDSSSALKRESRWGMSAEFVPANTSKDFHITNTRSIGVRELAKDATGLEQGPTGSAIGDPAPPAS